MLGNLFKEALLSLSTTSSKSAPPLSSDIAPIQEDIHCRDLLFPDEQTLYDHGHSNIYPLHSSHSIITNNTSTDAYDINHNIDIQLKDARIIIMQEATSSLASALLYDTHAPVDAILTDPAASNHSLSPRRVSIGPTLPMSITDPHRSAFDPRPSPHYRSGSYAETESQKSAREYREELTTFSGCIFGSSEIMANKATGTKVHVIPADNKPYTSSTSDIQNSLGRFSNRSSRLAQSYTSSAFTSSYPFSTPSRSSNKQKILITRIFPVALVSTDVDNNDYGKDEYPFPKLPHEDANKARTSLPKQRRTPMYAIAIVLTIPIATASISTRMAMKPSSYDGAAESASTSFNSQRLNGWMALGDSFGAESFDSILPQSDDHFDIVTQHWDIIVRTLNHLQSVVASVVHGLLVEVDHSSLVLNSAHGKRVEEVRRPSKPMRMNAKLVQLSTNALATNQRIKSEMGHAQLRIINGIKAQRVVTRQNRWGIWRDEARWVARRAADWENGQFFYNILTSFLGTHTEWLQALSPTWYRRQHNQQKSRDDDALLTARTIIISRDRMAARRLIFLLSAFLAPSQRPFSPHIHAPSSSAHYLYNDASHSPDRIGLPKDDMLRRKLNKDKHIRPRNSAASIQHGHDHARRGSDLKSANLPIPGSNMQTIKNTAPTTTSVVPVATIPHFSVRQKVRGTGPVPRPGSSGSLAADDLIRSLKRDDSFGQSSSSSTETSHWSAMSSWTDRMGLSWSRRRGSSRLTSTTVEEEPQQKSSLSQMVKDAQNLSNLQAESEHDFSGLAMPEQPEPHVYQSPIKSFVNEEDGVIEVDVPLPGFLSSQGSVNSSPSSSGFLHNPTSGLEGFECYTRGRDGDAPMNVGGWLPRFHPDFALQAIAEQDGLEDEIKAYMRAEPLPTLDRTSEDRWIDVTSSLVIDTASCTVKRLRYRRFILGTATPGTLRTAMSGAQMTPNQSASANVADLHESRSKLNGLVEEEFIEDVVLSVDPVLLDAVEKMIAQHQPDTAFVHAAESVTTGIHTPSSLRRLSTHDAAAMPSSQYAMSSDMEAGAWTLPQTGGEEVPREECKDCIVGALEDIAQQVAQARNPPLKKEAEDNMAFLNTYRQDHQTDSVLKEGVTSWLVAVENAA